MPHIVDLHFQGRRGVIATAVIPCDGGVVLVDPGPSSCQPALTRGLEDLGLGLRDVRAILLTHIHLDHAGAAGTMAQAWPGLPVYVHEIGARHLAAPEKLLASATRLYGAQMDRLWGEFKAVPGESLRVLTGGESLRVGGRTFDVAYTPGHAVHHVSYLDRGDHVAYVGDTAGIVVGDYVLAATPPPDIDIEAWARSLATLSAWAPTALFLTHFGMVGDATSHLVTYEATLARAAERVRGALVSGDDDSTRLMSWVKWLRDDVRRTASGEQALAAEMAAPFDQLWQGLARYWRKRVEREGPAALGTPPA